MPRKLKTFVTESGFFELAVAAPSMKAALKDWGIEVNLFQQGLARQTDDPAIVTVAEAAPGTVLRRPIGSRGLFREEAELPEVKGTARRSKAKSDGQARRVSQPHKKAASHKPQGTVDLRAIRQVRAALEAAETRHRDKTAALDKERDALERRVQREEEDWRRKKEKLVEKIDRLKA